jgi:hypothetical protein
VSQLYDIKLQIEAKIAADGIDAKEARGKIGLRSGKLLSLINPNTVDDAAIVAKLKVAAKEVLNLTL